MSNSESNPVEKHRMRVVGDAESPLRSEDILQGQREVKIAHAGETYRLLVTRNNKLILQK